MQRCLIAILALCAALTAAVANAQAPVPVTPGKVVLGAKLQDCHTGATPDQRYAVFVGQMPAIAGSKRMAMKFDLYERLVGPSFKRLSVPKFGVWQKSLANQTGFVFQKRIDSLVAPANYRVVVSFRWYGAHNAVIREAQKISPVCKQPDPRPDLVVGKVKPARGAVKGTLDYTITVRDKGLGDAGPFGLLLTVDGAPAPQASVAGLAAGATTDVVVNAPVCTAGSTITVEVDPANQVDEADETNNTFTRPCP
jgi:hypothetical protein